MKLVTFGCSFIHGDELIPDTPSYTNKHNIGGVINSNYKFDDYINFGNNGASNDRIVLQIMEYINSNYYDKNDFILIGLSGLPRTLKYINKGRYPLTIPNWSYDCHIKDTKHNITKYDDSKQWMDLVFKYEVNDRNDLVHYFLCCSTIKSLLSPIDKYLIFQSIDSPSDVYKSVNSEEKWNEVVIHHTTLNQTYTTESKLFFNESFIKKLLFENLKDTQLWENFSKLSYQSYINTNESYRCYGNHPNEIGAQKFFEKVLKKHIDKILL